MALAYPLFGTTATHFHALRQHWGPAVWEAWCRALAANKPFLVDGNSVVVKMVSRGEAWWGFTDSDDIAGAQREGFPVAPLPTTDETLFVPNTVGVIRNCPHPEAAERLYEFISNPKVSGELVGLHALEGATLEPATAATGLAVDWEQLLKTWTPSPKRRRKSFYGNAAHWIAATPPRSGRALEDAFEDFGRFNVDAAGFLRAGTRRGRRRH